MIVMNREAVGIIDQPDRAAAVLHPLRLRILSELGEPDSATGLARRLRLPRQQVNYHVRQLEADGLVEVVGERKRRNCTERLVRAVARSFVISPGTMGRLAASPEQVDDRFSTAYLVATASQAIQEVAALRAGADATGLRTPTLTLRTDLRFGSARAQQDFLNELTDALADLAARYHDDKARDGRRFRLMVGSWPVPPEIED